MLTYTCDHCYTDYKAKLKPVGVGMGIVYEVEKEYQIVYKAGGSEEDICYNCQPKIAEKKPEAMRKHRPKRLQA